MLEEPTALIQKSPHASLIPPRSPKQAAEALSTGPATGLVYFKICSVSGEIESMELSQFHWYSAFQLSPDHDLSKTHPGS